MIVAAAISRLRRIFRPVPDRHSFSIRFESAGDGTPENLERVRRGLEETLGIPAATVERMLAHAPVTVRNGLSEEQARQFARMLARGMSIGFYILTILFIRAGERKAAFAFFTTEARSRHRGSQRRKTPWFSV